MGDILSQAEVESLLSAIETGVPARPPRDMPNQPAAFRPREKVVTYDFKRPERVGQQQMRALERLHEGFGRNFGAALSGLLRSNVEAKLIGVDQLTYGEFVLGLENPTCFNLLRAEPLEGNLLLDINPSILYPIIDRMLGGGENSGPLARRPLTEIELRLVSRITALFLEEMRRAWASVIELQLSVERVESNPQWVQVVPANEAVVLVGFELTLQEARGMMNLCIPFGSIERIVNKLSGDMGLAYTRRGATPESIEQIGRGLQGAQMELVVELAQCKITTSDLIGLRVGDIITTEKDTREPLDVLVQGVTKFRAKPGAFKGRKAIQINQTIESVARPVMPATALGGTPNMGV